MTTLLLGPCWSMAPPSVLAVPTISSGMPHTALAPLLGAPLNQPGPPTLRPTISAVPQLDIASPFLSDA